MAKKVEAPGVPGEAGRQLTWREERFVEAYVKFNSRSGAYLAIAPGVTKDSARQLALRLLAKDYIAAAVEAERIRLRTVLQFSREDALKILVSIATTTPDQITKVMSGPSNRENYVGLHDKRYAINVQKTPDGYVASAPSVAERRAALNDLWEKLGLGKEVSARDRLAFFDRFLGKPRSDGSGSTEDGK